MDSLALSSLSASTTRDTSVESLWGSLHYFNLYRLTVACLFAFASFYLGQPGLFGVQNPDLTQWVSIGYLGSALILLEMPFHWRPSFDVLLTVEVAADVLALTLLMYANGGNRSGIGYMMLVVLAGAGLVGQGRLVLFYAAMATVAILLEQGYRMLSEGAELADFTIPALPPSVFSPLRLPHVCLPGAWLPTRSWPVSAASNWQSNSASINV